MSLMGRRWKLIGVARAACHCSPLPSANLPFGSHRSYAMRASDVRGYLDLLAVCDNRGQAELEVPRVQGWQVGRGWSQMADRAHAAHMLIMMMSPLQHTHAIARCPCRQPKRRQSASLAKCMQPGPPPHADQQQQQQKLREMASEHGVTLFLDLINTSAHGSGLGRRAAATIPATQSSEAAGPLPQEQQQDSALPQLLISVPMRLCLSDSIPGCCPAASEVARAIPAHLPWEIRLGALLMWATAPYEAAASSDGHICTSGAVASSDGQVSIASSSGRTCGGSGDGSCPEAVRFLRDFWSR